MDQPGPDEPTGSSDMIGRLRFIFGLLLVTAGAGVFAIAFRATLTAVYRAFYGQDNIVDSIAALPPWLRLTVPIGAAAISGTISWLRGTRHGRASELRGGLNRRAHSRHGRSPRKRSADGESRHCGCQFDEWVRRAAPR